MLYLFKQFWVGDLHVTGQVPRDVNDWDDGLVALDLVVFVSKDGQLVLLPGDWSHIPGNVVAPALRTGENSALNLTERSITFTKQLATRK